MPAPTKNTNARKGEVNRQMWSQRLPVDVIEAIKEEAETLEISQADYITILVRQPNKAIAAELLPWLLSEPFEPDYNKFNQSNQAGPQSPRFQALAGTEQTMCFEKLNEANNRNELLWATGGRIGRCATR